MSVKHWGEIPNTNPEILPDVTEDIEKAMDKFCLSEFELKDDSEDISRNITLSSEDPLVSYAITLHKHMDHMTDLIRLAELALETDVKPSKDAAPTIPPPPEIYLRHKKNCLNFIPLDATDFTSGKDVEIPLLKEQNAAVSLNRRATLRHLVLLSMSSMSVFAPHFSEDSTRESEERRRTCAVTNLERDGTPSLSKEKPIPGRPGFVVYVYGFTNCLCSCKLSNDVAMSM